MVTLNTSAKFEVRRFTRSWDNRGYLKIWKSRINPDIKISVLLSVNMADALYSRFILDKVMQFFKIFTLVSKILNEYISKMLATYDEQNIQKWM